MPPAKHDPDEALAQTAKLGFETYCESLRRDDARCMNQSWAHQTEAVRHAWRLVVLKLLPDIQAPAPPPASPPRP